MIGRVAKLKSSKMKCVQTHTHTQTEQGSQVITNGGGDDFMYIKRSFISILCVIIISIIVVIIRK